MIPPIHFQRPLSLRVTCSLMHCVRFGSLECAQLLLDEGADPNVTDSLRNTPLHLACQL